MGTGQAHIIDVYAHMVHNLLLCYITFLMLSLVTFEGNKNGVFPRENIPFRGGNNKF